MDFYEMLDQVVELLRSRQRVTYHTLKRQFALDDAALEDLKAELFFTHPQIADEDGRGLVWPRNPGPAPATPPAAPAAPVLETSGAPAPRAYTPPHLIEKILTSRSTLEGERKQVTVLFADVAGFTTLAEHLDPEVVHDMINRCFEGITAEVHRFEGTINYRLSENVSCTIKPPERRVFHSSVPSKP